MNNVYQCCIGGCNVFFIKNNGKFIMIDTGEYCDKSYFLSCISHIGINPNNISLLLLTHGHSDHVGNAKTLQNSYNIKIAMNEKDKYLVERAICECPKSRNLIGTIARAFINNNNNTTYPLFIPDILFDEDIVNLDQYGFTNCSIIYTPGHTRGSVSLIYNNLLFCGDLFMNIFYPQASLFADDFDLLDKSIEKIGHYNLTHCYPSHGSVFEFNKFLHKK